MTDILETVAETAHTNEINRRGGASTTGDMYCTPDITHILDRETFTTVQSTRTYYSDDPSPANRAKRCISQWEDLNCNLTILTLLSGIQQHRQCTERIMDTFQVKELVPAMLAPSYSTHPPRCSRHHCITFKDIQILKLCFKWPLGLKKPLISEENVRTLLRICSAEYRELMNRSPHYLFPSFTDPSIIG